MKYIITLITAIIIFTIGCDVPSNNQAQVAPIDSSQMTVIPKYKSLKFVDDFMKKK